MNTKSRREFLKLIPLSAAGTWAGAAGFTNLATSLFAPREAVAQAGGPATRPFLMVTLGDSIMWGQGLPENMKFRNIVASWIESQFQGTRKVKQICHAHSGAKTGFGAFPAETKGADPDSFYKQTPGYPFPGEVPFGYPSVSAQIGDVVRALQAQRIDPGNVDLVLFDGGANDISVGHVLDVTKVEFPANGPNWVRTNTNTMVVGHMRDLLPQVLGGFPNAAAVMTGYYPPVSESTDLLLLTAYLAILGLPAGVAIGAASDPLVDIGTILTGGISVAAGLRSALTLRSKAFAQIAFNGFSDLVSRANQGLATPRVALAWPQFNDDNCYGASNRYLFAAGEYLADEKRGHKFQAPPGDWATKQGIAYYRSEECSRFQPSAPLCYDASIGHPNEFGARAYADAVLSVMESFLAPHLATRGLVENPACPAFRHQEGLLQGQITDAQTEIANIGKEQRDCEAGIGEPSQKPKNCGALENKKTRDQLTNTIHQAGAQLDAVRRQKRQAGCWY